MKKFWQAVKNSFWTNLYYSSIGCLIFSVIDTMLMIIIEKPKYFQLKYKFFYGRDLFLNSFIIIQIPSLICISLISHLTQKDIHRKKELTEKRSKKRGAIIALLTTLLIATIYLGCFYSLEPYQQQRFLDDFYIPFFQIIEILPIGGIIGARAGKRIHAKALQTTQTQEQN